MTLREIGWIRDVQAARDAQTDFYTARIVSMIEAVNMKHPRFKPTKYMMQINQRQMTDRRPHQEPLTGDELLERLERVGYPIIDLRAEEITADGR